MLLPLSDLRLGDAGLYLCQLNTEDSPVRRVRLDVVERPGTARALQDRRDRAASNILGPSKLRLEAGARLRLECLVTVREQADLPAFFTW